MAADKRTNVHRIDRGTLEAPVELPNGWLKVDAYIARTGVQVYRKSDGTEWREYRPAETVFDGKSLASFGLVPLTNNHPPEGYLNADNTKSYQVGTVGHPEKADSKVRAQLLVTDSKTIAEMRAGKSETSCGYSCDLDFTPGEFEGERYDAVQRNVVANHVAIVREGRAGPEVRVRMDSLAHEVVLSSKDQPAPPALRTEPKTKMVKIKIDGVEIEVSELAAQLYVKQVDALKAKTDAETAKAEKEKARADAADGEVTKLKKELAEAPSKIKAAVAARTALETSARKMIAKEVQIDGLSDLELKRLAVETATERKLDGKSEAYVDAAFDIAVEAADGKADEATTSRVDEIDAQTGLNAADKRKNSDGAQTVEEARKIYNEKMRDAHKSKA